MNRQHSLFSLEVSASLLPGGAALLPAGANGPDGSRVRRPVWASASRARPEHLRVLREAGLVRVRREAQRRWHELRPGPLAEVDAWLEPYRRLWAARLDALEQHLDKQRNGGSDGDCAPSA